MRILIVEDEEKTAGYLRKGLTEKGFVVDVADNGQKGIAQGLAFEYDLIVLDVMLPDTSGWDVMKRLRAAGKQMPVLFLTARDAVADRVKGLELGADDYLIKPFAFSELAARIHTLLRRGPNLRPDLLEVADLVVDMAGMRVTRGGARIDLTPRELALLCLLTRHAGEVMTRTRIAERIWDMDFDSDTNVVDVHIRRLRAKLDDPYTKKLIHTVRGAGYVLEER
jgi:two-component system, OmpR family, copper resistance phosphate regulon response regulator CusR